MRVDSPVSAADAEHPLAHTLTPWRLGSLEVPHRVVMGSMHTGLELIDDGGEALAAFWRERVEGGAALIVTGGLAVSPAGRGAADYAVLGEAATDARLAYAVEAVHAAGGLVSAQLFHAGRYALLDGLLGADGELLQQVAPSAVPWRAARGAVPRALSDSEVWNVIGDYARAAATAVRLGFDAVEIMASEGYLVNQFCSPLTNLRDDAWGGDAVRRRRFALEVLTAVRAAVALPAPVARGAELRVYAGGSTEHPHESAARSARSGETGRGSVPVAVRVSGDDLMPGSTTAEEVDDLVRELVAGGVDAISVGVGWHESRVPTVQASVPHGAWLGYAERIAAVVRASAAQIGAGAEPPSVARAGAGAERPPGGGVGAGVERRPGGGVGAGMVRPSAAATDAGVVRTSAAGLGAGALRASTAPADEEADARVDPDRITGAGVSSELSHTAANTGAYAVSSDESDAAAGDEGAVARSAAEAHPSDPVVAEAPPTRTLADIAGSGGGGSGGGGGDASAAGAPRSVAVIASNRMTDLRDAEEVLSGGLIDAVALARPFLADPQLVARSSRGEFDLVNTCIGCNQACIDRSLVGARVSCLVNPRAGHESVTPLTLTTRRVRIAVVGAGPAGLAAAVDAARRGHEVTLFDAAAEPGGQFGLAARIPGKEDYAATPRSALAELRARGATLRFGERVTAEVLLGYGSAEALPSGAVASAALLGGGAVAPAALLGGGAVAPAALLGGGAVAPAALLGGGAVAPAALLGGGAVAPAALLGGGAAAPAALLSGDPVAPAAQVSGDTVVPAVQVSGDTVVPAVQLGGGAVAPAALLGGDAAAPAAQVGGGAVAPAAQVSGSTVVPAALLGGGAVAPAALLGGDPVAPAAQQSDDQTAPFGAVIIATGVTPRTIDLPGADLPHVITYEHALRHGVPAGSVAIIGGGGIGVDVAAWLTEPASEAERAVHFAERFGLLASMALVGSAGSATEAGTARQRTSPRMDARPAPRAGELVTVLRRAGRFGDGIGISSRWVAIDRLKAGGVRMLGGVHYERITPTTLDIVDADGVPQSIPAATVIVCAGQEPNENLTADLEAASMPFEVVGGAKDARAIDAVRATAEGLAAARRLAP
ncbi:MAG: 2,4-dienoyl-CoA reductase [Subtercola sp.]|nr:2,4-dienoyl-CoA reductase [Subtercola sp.]